MQIVIEIPEDSYKATCNGYMLPSDVENVVNAIKQGTPLPKGHGRLIDADTLEEKVEKHREMLKISEYDRELVLHYTDIEMAPTIIEANKEVEKNEVGHD